MTDHEFRLYAHRGASRKAPENSLAAFSLALDDGATALETDLHCTRDGHFVVLHDADGRRTAGEPAAVDRLDLAELKRWRLRPPPGTASSTAPHRVPTLDEVLESYPGIPVSVDLKPDRLGLAEALIALVERHSASDRVTISSFHDRVVARVRRLGYRGPTALTRREVALLRFGPLFAAGRLIRGQAAQIPCSAGGLRLDSAGFIARCRSLGLRADFWVVNDVEQARELIRRGATGIMTDDPAALSHLT